MHLGRVALGGLAKREATMGAVKALPMAAIASAAEVMEF